MAVVKKIAVCEYCDTRVALAITANTVVELKCTACGAPLRKSEFVEPSPSFSGQVGSQIGGEAGSQAGGQQRPTVQTLLPELSQPRASQPNSSQPGASQRSHADTDKGNREGKSGKYARYGSERYCDKSRGKYKTRSKNKSSYDDRKRYSSKENHKGKYKGKHKKKGFGYWVKKAVDEIDDIFD
ncbi:MAG: hypothetical protein KTR35_04280 [Gammaproteobacteria bacterium]|nr:hypothetical protein [Gammaproteobacteria bacterium]